MLEKNENIFYFDAHFHLADCLNLLRDCRVKPDNDMADCLSFSGLPSLSFSGLTRESFFETNWAGCSCSHSKEEWEATLDQIVALRKAKGPRIYLSYGLHPQSAGWIDIKQCADFLEQLLQQNKLNAIGEAGFDYFTPEFKSHAKTQEEMFNIQLALAKQYNLPLVIHCRKANEKLFEYSKELKKLPAVLFHSFMGMPNEAKSLMTRGINAYFSFGKQVMNNNKKVIACVKELPLENLLLETDAPFQYLKGEKFTCLEDIKRIYDAFIELRKESKDIVFSTLKDNFMSLYAI